MISLFRNHKMTTKFYLLNVTVVAVVLGVVCVVTTDLAEAFVHRQHDASAIAVATKGAITISRGGFQSRSAGAAASTAARLRRLHGTVTPERKDDGDINDDTDDDEQPLSTTRVVAAAPLTLHHYYHHHYHHHDPRHHRRHFLQQALSSFGAAAAAAMTTTITTTTQPAHAARGLILFPLTQPLSNKYHFMCAGTSLLQEQNIWSTNPLFLTNREDALSPTGIRQVQTVCNQFLTKTPGQFPTICYHSLAAKCMDTADLIGTSLQLGRERVVPEFTYLDGRGIGRWDNLQYDELQPAIWALDVDQAGSDGVGGRPPPNQDGTPNETLADQMVRLRQFLSLLESRSSGDTILLIFPDGTGPALLCAMMAGIPYNRVHELEFAPGEVRMDITPAAIQQWLQARDNEAAVVADYEAVIAKGRETLKQLRENENGEIVSFKDLKEKQERIAMDKVFQEEQETKRRAAIERQRKLQAELQARKQQEAEARKQKEEQQQQAASLSATLSSSSVDTGTDSTMFLSPGLAAAEAVAVLGGVAAAAAAVGVGVGTGTDNKNDDAGVSKASLIPISPTNNSTTLVNDGAKNNVTTTFVEADGLTPTESVANVTWVSGGGGDDALPTPIMSTLPGSAKNNVTMHLSTGTKPEGIRDLEAAQQTKTLSRGVTDRKNGSMDSSSEDRNSERAVVSSRAPAELWEPVPVVNGDGGLYGNAVVDKVQEAQRAMDDYLDLDDGGQDWLQSLAEIIAEPDDDADSGNDFQ